MRSEIRDAVRSLKPAQLLRLKMFAHFQVRSLGQKAAGRTFEVLLTEALSAAQRGPYAWQPGVDFYEHLLEKVRFVAACWRRGCTLEDRPEFLPNAWVACPAGSAVTTLDPERILAAKEELARLRKAFSNDRAALNVLDLLALGYKAAEIRNQLHLSSDEYGSATRRIRRKLEMLFPDLHRRPSASSGGFLSAQAYVCPVCDGKIEKVEVRDAVHAPAVYQWVCQGLCRSNYGPTWISEENQTVLLGATPWRKPPEQVERVEWSEFRDGERFFVIAVRKGDLWEFSERSTWECEFYGMKSTPELVAKVQRLADAPARLTSESDETALVIECLEHILGGGLQPVPLH